MQESEPQRPLDVSKLKQIDPLRPTLNVIEFFLVALALEVGISLVVSPSPTSSVPLEWRIAWRTLLISGALIILIGMFWRGRSVTALSIQQIGYIGLGFGSMAYGVGVGEWVTATFGPIAVLRSYQIHRMITDVYPEVKFLGGWRVWREGRKVDESR